MLLLKSTCYYQRVPEDVENVDVELEKQKTT